MPYDGVASAEREAMITEAFEVEEETRFRALRAELQASGKADEVTQSPEFARWMKARAKTDAAWGRWAMAIESRPQR